MADSQQETELTDAQWAWEFLRRNAQYREAWRELQAWEALAPEYDTSALRIDAANACHLEVLLDPETPVTDVGWSIWSPVVRPAEVVVVTADDQRDLLENFVMTERWIHHRLSLCFNLTRPVSEQLDKAREILEYFKDHLPDVWRIDQSARHHRRLFWTYLAIFDRHAQGETLASLASEFFSNLSNEHPDYHGSKKVDDTLRAARRYIDGDYVLVLAPWLKRSEARKLDLSFIPKAPPSAGPDDLCIE